MFCESESAQDRACTSATLWEPTHTLNRDQLIDSVLADRGRQRLVSIVGERFLPLNIFYRAHSRAANYYQLFFYLFITLPKFRLYFLWIATHTPVLAI